MRLYPVTGDGTNRITTRDTRIGQYLLPKGTMVWVPFSAAFNSPHNFSKADDYVPVRFSHSPSADYPKLTDKSPSSFAILSPILASASLCDISGKTRDLY